MNSFTEEYHLSDRTIKITHKSGIMHLFWIFLIKPFTGPFNDFIYNFKASFVSAAVFSIFAWFQGLFETSVVLDLFVVPTGLIEGLYMLVGLDFIFGTARAVLDPKIKFHVKKWIKSFFKLVTYTGGILVLTIGANMFPTPFEYILQGSVLLLVGYEIWSCMKHLKLTAVFYAAIELYKDKGSLVDIDIKELFKKIDERSHKEFTEKQMYFFGDEVVEVENKKD